MKLVATFLSIFACAAFADQEFYRGDTTYYVQPGAPKKQREGFISFPGGTYMRMSVGMLDQIALRITPSEIQVLLPQNTETLTGEKKSSFLSGKMVTLSSGCRVQFFRPPEKMPHRLLIYSPSGGLETSVDLIEKKA